MLSDLVDLTLVPDLAAEAWNNPHFSTHVVASTIIEGCPLSFAIRPDGLVYCLECEAQIGNVGRWAPEGIWFRRDTNGESRRGDHLHLFPEYYSKKGASA